MEITAINMTKRGRYSIYVDGEFACALHEEIFVFAKLSVGDVITADKLSALLYESNEKLAREHALKLLARRVYPRAELKSKLAEKWGWEAAESAVRRMMELGYVDDYDYARRFVADAVNLKMQGIVRISRTLAEKGIDREIIEAVLAERKVDPEQELAVIVLRKYMRYLADEKGIQKATQALARLGWRYEDIRKVLRNLCENENYYGGE